MGLMLQVTWQLMNLFIIAVAILVPGSPGFGEPLSLESSSPIPSIETQVPNFILEQEPLQNGLIVQPPISSPSINSPPVYQLIQGPPPFPTPRQSNTLPPQHGFHGSTPTSSEESPSYSAFPSAKAPQESTSPPAAQQSNDLAPSLQAAKPPHYTTQPASDEPSYDSIMIPSVEPPRALAVPPTAKPPVVIPQVSSTISPPEPFPLASPSPHMEVSQHNTTMQSLPIPPIPESEAPIISTSPSVLVPQAAKPLDLKPPLPAAEPPYASAIPLAAKPPVAVSRQPTSQPPEALASPSPPREVSQHNSTMQSPPMSGADAPVVSTPPTVLAPSHASSQPLDARPPQSKPIDFKPPLPIAETPHAKSPGILPQLPSAEPPKALPQAFPSPPPKFSQHSSTMQSPPIPTETPVNLTPPTVMAPSHASSHPLVAKPPHSSDLPFVAKPPLSVAEPPHASSAKPPLVIPQLPSAQPPEVLPHIPVAEAPPNSTSPAILAPTHALAQPPRAAKPSHIPALPLAANPPFPEPPLPTKPPQGLNLTPPPKASPILPLLHPTMPPHPLDTQSPPPELGMPNASSPPPQLSMPNKSSPMPQPVPPHQSSPSPQSVSPYTMSPPPQLVLPHAPPPTSTVPSNASLPPSMAPPTLDPPPTLASPSPLPSNVLSPPPQHVPPILSSPPPQLIPPIASSPLPQLIPPPASPPTSAFPSNASVPPSSVMPPPDLPLPPPAVPPHSSAMPSHASAPLPQLAPPHPSPPPYVLPAPPPLELPHISPPRSSIVPGEVPPNASPPSPFLTPLSPASPANPSQPLSAPPSSEPLHSSVPPSPVRQQTVPTAPPQSSQRKETPDMAPPPSLASPERSPSPRTLPEGAPPGPEVTPRSLPPSSHQSEAPKHAPISRPNVSEPNTSPLSAPPPSNNPVSGRSSPMAPPGRAPNQSPEDKFSPHHAPSKPKFERHNANAPAPFSFKVPPANNGSHHSLHHSPVTGSPTAMGPLPSPPGIPEITPAPSPLQRASPGNSGIPFLSPKISPSGSSTRKTKRPLAPPIWSLPPPPPNADCAYLTCPEPFTNTPPGSPCGCVWPMQVGLRLSVPLYTFFPLVSELSREIAAGVFMKQSQVRVMGANAASQESDKTIALVDLVPLDEKFDNVTALLTFQRFWHKQVIIDKSIFGDYDVLYVRYPGLPASPPMAPADIAVINGMPYSVRDPNQNSVHPLGVDVTKQKHKKKLSGIVIAAIIFSAIVCVLICCSVAWVLLFRHMNRDPEPVQIARGLPSLGRSSGPTGNSIGSGPSSSLSIGSNLAAYTGSAKTFNASEIEKATDGFSPSRIVGEGGFGLVYGGVLEDETSVAVKVLKRDDQQGGREFLAEVEMLSRLHHRNLVKLIGICTDEHLRCLIYELIPNGSVESHLHDKETAPLDWASRMKIALGAARGLAYLHEDSSPRVIHRDFKSSNILLENDFTPKVSDFGLARSAMDGDNQHISTRVMGTFGYVAPEYAMTGHLLVKSDVYSYGVVLLELLTGRKPVDMTQPPGQENLAAWTRPFLTTKEGIELILDPSLGSDVSLDSAAKVAAIASMCVQSEVSHRPFMGEVVQALKLVCDECDDSRDGNSRHGSHENLSVDYDDKASPVSEAPDYLPTQFSLQNYQSALDVEKGMSMSENFNASARTYRQTSDSFQRHSASGPLKTTRGRNFWQKMRLSNGSASEHGIMYRLWAGSH
ncbi:proline-rich protein 36-like isoform X2 [Chenopodium quinoa]|uniref:proline-rich protein 36-like isoform X2 n=1 Tax=Chenopodium quinoa TaxID=63459 RepID=UPI000B7815A4|nr:proline-rich protein 36-like isoform X2 [Chenopodium quinoa]